MALDLYDDRAFVDVYNAEEKAIEKEIEIDDERGFRPGGKSHITQIKKRFAYWCPDCECAFEKGVIDDAHTQCPMCGAELEEFDLENIVPDFSMDIEQDEEGNWVPKGE